MKVLVINAGSSSLKYQLIDMDHESVIAKGLCERIGIDGSKHIYKTPGREDYVEEAPMPTHQQAIALVLKALVTGFCTEVPPIPSPSLSMRMLRR
jgi:acetate kinase